MLTTVKTMVHIAVPPMQRQNYDNQSVSSSRARRSHEPDVEAQDHHAAADDNHGGPFIIETTDKHAKFASDDPLSKGIGRSDTIKSLRRRGRAATKNVTYKNNDRDRPPGWTPGQEPGFDTADPAPPYSKIAGGDPRHPEQLRQKCGITVVDYSTDYIDTTDLDNDNLEEFLNKPQPEWVQVRWINCDGLSWDVIRLLGNYKGLHRLAIEDMMQTRNRTKADWYRDHTYMVLPLQKLIRSADLEDSDSESDDDYPSEKGHGAKNHVMSEVRRKKRELRQRQNRPGPIRSLLNDISGRTEKKKERKAAQQRARGGLKSANSFTRKPEASPWAPKTVRTLQRYHSGSNEDR